MAKTWTLFPLQVADDVLGLGLAAVLFAIGDDIDDSAPAPGCLGGGLGGGEDGVVEGMGFARDLLDAGRASGTGRGERVDVVFGAAVEVDAAGERLAGVVVHGFASGGLGPFDYGAEARALSGGEVGLHLGAVVVGEDGDLVVGGEGSLQRVERIVDAGHGVIGQALIDNDCDGERKGIDGERAHVLAEAVLVDVNILPVNAGGRGGLYCL